MNRMALLATLALSTSMFAADSAGAAPKAIPDHAVDLELKAVDVATVFQALGQASDQKLVLDPCVTGKIDLKLANVPLPLVFDMLASKLGLRYETREGATFVTCGPAVAAPTASTDVRLSTRVSVDERDATVRAVLRKLAASAKLAGVDTTIGDEKHLSITLEKVRLETALAAVGDATGLRLSLKGDKIVGEPTH